MGLAGPGGTAGLGKTSPSAKSWALVCSASSSLQLRPRPAISDNFRVQSPAPSCDRAARRGSRQGLRRRNRCDFLRGSGGLQEAAWRGKFKSERRAVAPTTFILFTTLASEFEINTLRPPLLVLKLTLTTRVLCFRTLKFLVFSEINVRGSNVCVCSVDRCGERPEVHGQRVPPGPLQAAAEGRVGAARRGEVSLASYSFIDQSSDP